MRSLKKLNIKGFARTQKNSYLKHLQKVISGDNDTP
jgi:hypothetical protein